MSLAEKLTSAGALLWGIPHLLGTRKPWQTPERRLTVAAVDFEGGGKGIAGHASLKCILNVQRGMLNSS